MSLSNDLAGTYWPNFMIGVGASRGLNLYYLIFRLIGV